MKKQLIDPAILKKETDYDNHHKVYSIHDDSNQLIGYVAIHSVNGSHPSSGGTRFVEYDLEQVALADVLRLSKHMTKKYQIIGLPYGGAKAVFLANRIPDKKSWLMNYPSLLNELHEFITGTDAGLTDKDIQSISKETKYIVGSVSFPSKYTAEGLLLAMQCCLKEELGKKDFQGITIAVQGVGNIGSRLIEALYPVAKEIYISDTNEALVQALKKKYPNIHVVSVADVHKQKVDIFSPCGFGQTITDKIINELNCKMIIGAANNQLARPDLAKKLHEKGILYAPDFLVNSGGMIAVTHEYETNRQPQEEAIQKTLQNIPRILAELVKVSHAQNIPIAEALMHKMEKHSITEFGSGSRLRQS